MGRLPWTSGPYRGGHEDAGMEHLETDVMRFLAILALCLVAIFALVQSMPLDAPQPPVAEVAVAVEPPPDAEPRAVAPAPADEPEQAAALPAPVRSPPRPEAVPEPAPVSLVVPRPASTPSVPTDDADVVTLTLPPRPAAPPRPSPPPAASLAAAPAATPARVSAPPPPEALLAPANPDAVAVPSSPPPSSPADPADDIGFTLRFESDAALRALVARDEVALYALADGKAWRAMWFDSYLGFRPAQVPGRYHEMAAQTVPAAAVSTLRQRVAVDPATLRWGVTLPASTSAELQSILAVASGGDLVIDANAQLRLESGT